LFVKSKVQLSERQKIITDTFLRALVDEILKF